MATFGGYTVVKRYNRPNVTTKTLLELFLANNGTYFAAEAVSAVFILPDTGYTKGSPDLYINRAASDIGTPEYGLLNAAGVSSTLAQFDVSNNLNAPALDAPGSYDPMGPAASSIYQVAEGHMAVVLQEGGFPGVSAIGDYFDIWLVKDFVDANYRLYWNKFTLYDDRIISYTEPYQVTSRNELVQKYIVLGSKERLRINTDHFLANRDLSDDLKNIWRSSVIGAAEIQIRMRHPQTTGEMTTIVPFTSSSVEVSSEDTISYLWDTTLLSRGDYTVQVKYTLLDQTILSEVFSVILR